MFTLDKLSQALSILWEQSHWDWPSFVMWGEALAIASFCLSFLVALVFFTGRFMIQDTKRRYAHMRDLFKMIREGAKEVKKGFRDDR